MIKLQHPEALYLFFLLLPFTGLFVWYLWGRRRSMARFGDQSLAARLMPDRPSSKHSIKFVLLMLAFSALVMALANPQMGRKTETVQREGVDLFLVLDISRSMLAEDETPNRLARSKQLLSRLIEQLGGDRVGVIVFAGYPYLQVPLTTDYGAVRSMLKTVNTDLAGTQGTNIGASIEMAQQAFERAGSEHRVIVILSDGEDHQADAMDQAKAAADAGTTIYTIGIGSPKGAPIPNLENGRNSGFKQDNSGSIVLSKLNEEMLTDIAKAGGGQYLHLEGGNSTLNRLRNALAGLEKSQYEAQSFTDYEDQYQWLLAIGLLLLVVEYFLSERRTRLLSRVDIFNR
jgi:Ca-activated chloride channel family protein